ncbi:hypothetical protein CspHIS471_0502410 [Cutaneotrichosporon sp. HIS471]|nr:hypothetical protein CspHIS471_0502410 [Cutaneotrichosporon sp. HIS471]
MTKPQFLIDLERDGYVVVPNVIPKEECAAFRQSALEWLESFPHGFKRDDRSTWTDQHLPFGTTGGLYNRYAVNHEDFVWRIRIQPGILNVFNQIWGTDDLITSFDGMNTSIPINPTSGRTDISPTPAWPHIDQNPRRIDRFELYQVGGIPTRPDGTPDPADRHRPIHDVKETPEVMRLVGVRA